MNRSLTTYAPPALMVIAGIVMLVIAATSSHPSREELARVDGTLRSYVITSLGRSGGRLVLSIDGASGTFWNDIDDTTRASARLQEKPHLSLLIDPADRDLDDLDASVRAYTIVAGRDTIASYDNSAGNDGTRVGIAVTGTLLILLGWRFLRRAVRERTTPSATP